MQRAQSPSGRRRIRSSRSRIWFDVLLGKGRGEGDGEGVDPTTNVVVGSGWPVTEVVVLNLRGLGESAGSKTLQGCMRAETERCVPLTPRLCS